MTLDSLTSPHRAGPLIALLSALTLVIVFISQYGFGLAPCELCLWQRWPYAAAILFGIAALLLPRWRAPLLLLTTLSFVIGGGIAVFHSGVEWKWWQGLTSCGGIGPTPITLEELRAQILAAPVVRCDEAAVRVFGLSMAGWNVIWSAALAMLSLLATIRAFQERR